MTRLLRTITAPNGKSARRASSIAMRMKRSSSAVEGAAGAPSPADAIGMAAATTKPVTTERRLRPRGHPQS
jgi:hypothetical protein